MTNRWETVRVKGSAVVDAVGPLVREGSIRRVAVKHAGRLVAEFPLTVGVVEPRVPRARRPRAPKRPPRAS